MSCRAGTVCLCFSGLSFPEGICCLLVLVQILCGTTGEGHNSNHGLSFTVSMNRWQGTSKQQIPSGNDNKKSKNKKDNDPLVPQLPLFCLHLCCNRSRL